MRALPVEADDPAALAGRALTGLGTGLSFIAGSAPENEAPGTSFMPHPPRSGSVAAAHMPRIVQRLRCMTRALRRRAAMAP